MHVALMSLGPTVQGHVQGRRAPEGFTIITLIITRVIVIVLATEPRIPRAECKETIVISMLPIIMSSCQAISPLRCLPSPLPPAKVQCRIAYVHIHLRRLRIPAPLGIYSKSIEKRMLIEFNCSDILLNIPCDSFQYPMKIHWESIENETKIY